MKKIPTLFVRDPEDRKVVLNEITPGCEWVLAGEGRPTRKFDGTCVLIRRDGLAVHAFARREVKPGKEAPPNFVEVEHDETTGKTMGWEPAAQSGFAALIDEAIRYEHGWELTPGTYELIGPKINGNPEGVADHMLVPHGYLAAVEWDEFKDSPRDFDGLRRWLLARPYEGIVWHHPDGPMVKLKKRDFRG